IALPTSGYVARGNVSGVLRYRNAAAGDFRLTAGSGCASFLRSGPLPLAPFG
ncbi:MAG: hypothetical protein JWM25_133, partial [Thermoleophilia bacterium]|nr:hypothetical protein [Thermoleophilia bacterium]